MARTKRKENPVVSVPVQKISKQRVYRACGYVRLSMENSGKAGGGTIAVSYTHLRAHETS